MTQHRSGYVALLGAPNAGKSTLLNAILGESIAAVTPKPQTTRIQLKGIYATPECQMILLDTPGIHHSPKKLNQVLLSEVDRSVNDADILCYLFPANETPDLLVMQAFYAHCAKFPKKMKMVLVTKADLGTIRIEGKGLGEMAEKGAAPVFPISAQTQEGLKTWLKAVEEKLPEGPAYYDSESLTDVSMREIAAEIIRERVMEHTFEEIPYCVAVRVDRYKEPTPDQKKTRIEATVIVDQESQKGMVIGKGGLLIKKIGTEARIKLEKITDTRVHLALNVKVDHNWIKSDAKMAHYGYRLNEGERK